MLGVFLSLLLVIAFMFAVSGLISALISGKSPVHTAAKRVQIAQVARREAADLDRQYEQLLQG